MARKFLVINPISLTQNSPWEKEMMMMKSVFWWRKPEYPEETTDLRQVTDETLHTIGLCPVRGLNLDIKAALWGSNGM